MLFSRRDCFFNQRWCELTCLDASVLIYIYIRSLHRFLTVYEAHDLLVSCGYAKISRQFPWTRWDVSPWILRCIFFAVVHGIEAYLVQKGNKVHDSFDITPCPVDQGQTAMYRDFRMDMFIGLSRGSMPSMRAVKLTPCGRINGIWTNVTSHYDRLESSGAGVSL